jgi:hypothetical protein
MRRTFAVFWFGVLWSACNFEIQGAEPGIDGAMPVTVAFRSSMSVQDESSGTIGVPVTLSAAASDAVTVHYRFTGGTAAPGTDYEGSDGTLKFEPGDTEAAIPVTILEDDLEEPAETIELELSMPTNAVLGTAHHTVTIAANILPRIRFEVSASEGQESTSPELTLALDSEARDGATVDFVVEGDATPGVDHMLAAGTLTIPPGVKTLTLPLQIVDDALDEYDETVVVRLTSSTDVVVAEDGGQHTYTIQDDDPEPTVTFSLAAVTVTEGSSGVDLNVQLSAPSEKPIKVPFSVEMNGTATLGEDFTLSPMPGELQFAPGETTKTITIGFPDDDVHEGTETAALVLGPPMNAQLGATTRFELTITDDDPEPTVAWGAPGDRTVNEGNSGTQDHTYNLVLSGPSAKTVTLQLSIGGTAKGTPGDGRDYSIPTGSMYYTFAPGTTTQPVVVRVNGDTRSEQNETVVMTISSATNATIGTPNVRTHTIQNDD